MLDFININYFCLALAINTFFRKSFKMAENSAFLAIWLFLVGTTSKSTIVAVCSYSLAAGIIAIITSKRTQEYQKFWMENTDRQDLLNFVITYFFVNQACGLVNQLPNEDLLSSTWKWVPIMSLLQITRNPVQLKNFLRPIRVACGPTSICAAVLMGYLQATSPLWSLPKFLLAVACSCCSFTAGFIFRPDNFEVLNIIPVVANNNLIKANAKNIHAYSNITAVLAAIVILTLP